MLQQKREARYKPRMGRKRSKDPRSSYVRLRCKPSEKAEWFAAAGGERAFSDWARQVLNAAAANFEKQRNRG